MPIDVVIVDAIRSPIGRHHGALSSMRPDDLLATALKALVLRVGLNLTTLLLEMKRRAPQEGRPYYGLATLCVGVGMGFATLVEWLG